MTAQTLSTYFISHGGGPWPWIKDLRNGAYDRLEASLNDMPRRIGMTPKAVVVISGHWEERDFTVMSSANPTMIYDYSGFPDHTNLIKYAARGSPQTAERVRALIEGGRPFGTRGPAAGVRPRDIRPVGGDLSGRRCSGSAIVLEARL